MIENARNYQLTTIDNPINPFIDFSAWYEFDQQHNYCTLERFALFYIVDETFYDSLDEYSYSLALEKMMDLFPYYILVDKDTEIHPIDMETWEKMLLNDETTS